ncbi:MAG: helix-turn-helix domain-containing protein [Nanoarchaeota archaeon]|nr:helix-turn-helix domain-containing protein [Nanoarchaeota archaeon]
MDKKEFEFLLKSGEGINLEFKESFDSKNIAKSIVAFANSEGGRILLGVNDKCQVKGINITNKLKSEIQDIARNCDPEIKIVLETYENVLIIHVEEGKNKPYRCSQGFSIREGSSSQKLSTDEIREFFNKERKIIFDEKINPDFTFKNGFDKKKFNAFIEKAKIIRTIPDKEILKNIGVLSENGEDFKNAGALFFCDDIEKFLPHAIITCVLYKGLDKVYIIDKKDFHSDILTNYNEALNYFYKNLRLVYKIEGFGPRKEILELPDEALKEALINAIAHRDYNERGARIQVDIFDDRVEISNPGGLIIKEEEFGKRSLSRNPLIFGLLQRLDLVEKVGSGIKRIKDSMKRLGLKPPKFEFGKFFAIVLYRPTKEDLGRFAGENAPQKTPQKTPQKPTELEQKILNLIRNKPAMPRSEIAKELSIADDTVKEYLAKLKIKGFLKRIGADRGGYWEVKDEN